MQRLLRGLALLLVPGLSLHAGVPDGALVLKFPPLDMQKVAAEDNAILFKEHPARFAIGRDVELVPGKQGGWIDGADGRSLWRVWVTTPDAVHLNFGFSRFYLPPSASLLITSSDKQNVLGPYGEKDNQPTAELWTQVLAGREALIELSVASHERDRVDLRLSRVGQGYRGFGGVNKFCKSGACNTDVACLANDDPWNEPRRAVAAITVNGTDTCTGSLVNNSNNDRRLLFATASHCNITGSNVASVLAYFNYESASCRTPGSSASGTVQPRPSTTLSGLAFLAATNSPFSGSTPGNTRSDWTLIELQPRPEQSSYNLFWAGWDRNPPPTTCSVPGTPSGTTGLCASIHHPGVDEKRITFVEVPMTLDNISSAVGVHWQANWDPTPPILANVPAPQPASLPPSVTEPGSSGSPLYNAERRLVGVLSGGPSACGATGASLRDQYGGLFHSWEGLGSITTRMKDHLDPSGANPFSIDGIGQCTPPAVPSNVLAAANGDNRIDVSWSAVSGAERYRVFRAFGACPGGAYTQIAEVTGTTYSDTTVSGGSVYSYRVSAYDEQESCESPRAACSSAPATGVCQLAPSFGGLTSASSAGSVSCGINLTWPVGSGNCGGAPDMRYNVYRSTTAGFAPGAGNRIAACSSAASLSDSTVVAGTRYYYVVRAEDVSAAGAGVCGGIEDSNTVERNALPTGPDTNLFSDDVEGAALWTAAGTGSVGANFAVVTSQANSPTRAWFVPDPDNVQSRTLTSSAPIVLPANPATLEFFHRYATESGYDGGILEYSLDGGTTWTDILAGQDTVPANANRFIVGGYNGVMNSSGAFGARTAWHGSFNTAWIRSALNLADFANRSLSLRFRAASDSSVLGTGWWIDDIRVYYGSTCQNDPSFVFQNGFE